MRNVFDACRDVTRHDSNVNLGQMLIKRIDHAIANSFPDQFH